MHKIKIIIADDHVLFIEGLKMLLQDEHDMEIVATTHEGKELLKLLKGQEADVVLLDINMPGLNGLEVVRHISAWNSSVKVIMLSTYGEAYMIDKAKANGASGYLLKTSPKQKLLNAIKQVHQGLEVFPTDLENAMPSGIEYDDFLKQFNLSRRELEIIQYIKNGQTSKEIADVLCLSEFTVKTHRKNISSKLGVKSLASLMKFINDNNL